MHLHNPSMNTSTEPKTQAAFRLSNFKQKLRRVRHKRELINLPFSEGKNFEKIFESVRGTESWAKIAPGSVKIVKRYKDLTP